MRVVFRRFKDEADLVALFIDEIADPFGNIMSYQHVGQHGAADLAHCMSVTEEVTPKEYAPLLRELTTLIGYKDLQVIEECRWCTECDRFEEK